MKAVEIEEERNKIRKNKIKKERIKISKKNESCWKEEEEEEY